MALLLEMSKLGSHKPKSVNFPPHNLSPNNRKQKSSYDPIGVWILKPCPACVVYFHLSFIVIDRTITTTKIWCKENLKMYINLTRLHVTHHRNLCDL